MSKSITDKNKLNTKVGFALIQPGFQLHRFHILRPSFYPLFVSTALFVWLFSQCLLWHGRVTLPISVICASFAGLFFIALSWFYEVILESTRGFHSAEVVRGLRFGVVLFIVSEIMFFFGFFWAFFHFSLVPSVLLGAKWPAPGTQALSPWGLPLLNTILLLSSGVTVTQAHALVLLANRRRDFTRWMAATIVLGTTFLLCQMFEYKYGVQFSWRGNAYGTLFFITTGFHGLHVTVGTLFLFSVWARSEVASVTCNAHVGFEGAAWYWHFVDVVWLFLFVVVYYWGGV